MFKNENWTPAPSAAPELSTLSSGIALTYTGTPQTRIVLALTPPNVVVPIAAAAGSNEYTAQGAGIMELLYTENGATLGNRLATISFDDLKHIARDCSLTNCAALTSAAFPQLISIGGQFNPSSMAALTSLTAPNLVAVGGGFAPSGLAVTTLSFPALVSIRGNFQPSSNNAVTSLNFPALTTVMGNFSSTLGTNGVLTATFTALSFIGGTATFAFGNGLVTLSLPALATLPSTLVVSGMSALTTLSFAGLVRVVGNITITTGLGNLTTVTLGTIGTTKALPGQILISGQKLTAASVNALLALLVSLDGSNGTTNWVGILDVSGGTSSAPTGQGLTDQATLEGRGALIQTN